MEKVFGLIGYPLSHSFSVPYFAEKFQKEGITDTVYKNFPIEDINLFPSLIKSTPGLLGLNVTIPYKTQVIPYLDKLSESAAKIGAVNTIKLIKKIDKIELHGFNTDEYGFRLSLTPSLKNIPYKALILGTGGASKAVEYVLNQLQIPYFLVSRKPNADNEIAYREVNSHIIEEHKLIINTSPVGMYPNIEEAPEIPYRSIGNEHILYDLIYNPSETEFLKLGSQQGATTLNGLKMLHLQADRAWEIWNL